MKQTDKKENKEDVIKKLEMLTQEPGFIYSFSVALAQDFFLDPAESANINWMERLSFQEASFIFGLICKKKINTLIIPDEKTATEHIEGTKELCEQLHWAHNQPFIDKIGEVIEKQYSQEDAGKAMQDFFASGEMMTEPIFYGGSGAYDFQYWELALKKYASDDEWIRENFGIDIKVIVEMSKKLKKLQERRWREISEIKSFQDYCKFCFSVFCFGYTDFDFIDKQTFDIFIKLFSAVPGEINKDLESVGAYNVIDSNPIVAVKSDLYFMPLSFNLARSAYESPFYWMRKDENYKDACSKHRGETTEEIAYDFLIRSFGEENVHKNVKIFRKKGELITDIDILAIAGNKAVVVQIKSKKLTELSRKGDEETLREDFKKAIQDAYNQSLKSRKAVIEKGCTFLENNGKELKLSEEIDDAYIICLTSDNYPAVTHQVDTYLQKEEGDPYPLAMNLSDLDILTFYLDDPFDFLYYLRQRTVLSSYFTASSEIVLLAFHLNQKLFRNPEFTRMSAADDFAQLIDANFPAMRGYEPKTAATERLRNKWKNDKFNLLIEQIKETNDPGLTDALFFLFDLSEAAADKIIRLMEKTKERARKDGGIHDFSLINEGGNSGVSYVSLPAEHADKFDGQLFGIACAKKYKSKADHWLALGSITESSNVIDGIVFSDEPWKENLELEKSLRLTLRVSERPKRDGKKIGRNDPCFCGSEKKFKKCCG